MATDPTVHRAPARRRVLVLGRVASAVLLGAMGGIHLQLWFEGYRDVPLIGPAFLANAAGGLVLGVAVLAVSRRALPVVLALAAVFTAGTLIALLASLTVGLLGFTEVLSAPLVPTTLVVESVGLVVLVSTTVVAVGPRNADRERGMRR